MIYRSCIGQYYMYKYNHIHVMVYYLLCNCVFVMVINIQCVLDILVVNQGYGYINISAILWWSVILVEETGVPGENRRFASSQRQTLSHNVVLRTTRQERESNSQLYTDSCKSNYHTITTTTIPCVIIYIWVIRYILIKIYSSLSMLLLLILT